MKVLDTALQFANSIHHNNHEKNEVLSLIYYTRAGISYAEDYDVNALEDLILSWELGKQSRKPRRIFAILVAISSIKSHFAQENESTVLAKKAITFLQKEKSSFSDYEEQSLWANSVLARSYAHSKELDSALIIVEKCVKQAKRLNHYEEYIDLRVLEAKINYYKGNYQHCIDTLNKYTKCIPEDLDDFYYLGMAFNRSERTQQSISHLIIFDSLLKSKGYPLRDNVIEGYQFLLNQSLKNKDETKANEYLQRLVYYDSLLQATQAAVRKITLEDFDIPLEKEEKASLFNALDQKSSTIQWLYVIAFVLLITLIGLYVNQNNTKNRLKQVMAQTIEMEVHPHMVNRETSTLQPSEELAKAINRWEEKKGFLDPGISLQGLAKRFNTNTAYLSKNVNIIKGQNFASYLKDIRVTHAINYMKAHPDIIRDKSQIQIAELFGFSSVSVFNRALKSKIKVTIGAFTKEIRKQHKTSTNP
ncbi:MAG: AraC family transcriptional regulator [Bacteroidota bacterium]